MRDALNAVAVRRWVARCVHTLDEQREAIDGINVFPVADRDTGTNLLRTMRAAADAVNRVAPHDADNPAAVWSALASGALAGARGNSGVILSQVLRGLAEVLGEAPSAVRAALCRADELATRAVSDPVSGTMLSVLHAVAVAVAAVDGAPAEATALAVEVATAELARTTSQLDVLARAGVVDAGAQGLLCVLTELAAVVSGQEPPAVTRSAITRRLPRDADALSITREAGSPEYAYEVMYALEQVGESAADVLRGALLGLGDCVSVVGDGAGHWAVHVHCNDVGAVIEAGVDIGRPHRIAVVRFDDAVPSFASRFAVDHAVVALARGAGIAALFRAEGAAVLELSEAGVPDVGGLLAVIVGTQASHVTVLANEPGASRIVDAAREQAVRAGQDVLVVPSVSPVQGLAALAVHDSSRRPVDDVVAMAEAAAATRRGDLTLAHGEGITWVGRCQPGDILALLDGEVVTIRSGPATDDAVLAAACGLLDLMLSAGGELVSALAGRGASPTLLDSVAEHVRTRHRGVEFAGYVGDQADSIVVFGVE